SKVKSDDALWLNGDVVFDHRIISRLIKNNHSCMAVNTMQVGEEEIKYVTNGDGSIKEVSKQVQNGFGEAVGINLIKAIDLDLFKKGLKQCSNTDYFEKGLELAIEQGLKIYPADISDLNCVEVDFIEDLEKANNFGDK
ncbi:MAG: phosphocholine cytidylyltransferase family protein, partial [Gammaproteobacteria bacterium]